jgi:hypothetical protein
VQQQIRVREQRPVQPPPELPPACHPFNKNNITVLDLGHMDVKCPKCSAWHWDAEKLAKSTIIEKKFGMCCFQGKISLPHLDPLSDELYHFYHNDDCQAKAFCTHI